MHHEAALKKEAARFAGVPRSSGVSAWRQAKPRKRGTPTKAPHLSDRAARLIPRAAGAEAATPRRHPQGGSRAPFGPPTRRGVRSIPPTGAALYSFAAWVITRSAS